MWAAQLTSWRPVPATITAVATKPTNIKLAFSNGTVLKEASKLAGT
jgi:hypothetical protein